MLIMAFMSATLLSGCGTVHSHWGIEHEYDFPDGDYHHHHKHKKHKKHHKKHKKHHHHHDDDDDAELEWEELDQLR